MKKKLLIILTMLCGIANAQITFQTTFVNSETFSIKQTSDGGYVAVGHTTSYSAGMEDIYLIKIDLNGNTQWAKTYGAGNDDFGYSVQQTSDAGYVIVGLSGSGHVYLIKTDGNGNLVWTKTYGGSVGDYGYSVQQTTDGGYIITGFTQSFGSGNADVYLIKTTGNGSIVWTKTYGGTGSEVGYSVQQTSDGGYIISGTTQGFGAGLRDVYLIKTDGNGTIIWSKSYGGTLDDYGRSVQQTTDGGYIVAGSMGYDVYLIKTNTTGDTLWTKTYGGTGVDDGYSVQQTVDGGYIIAGSTTSFGAGTVPDVYLIKTDLNGNLAWSRMYGGTGYDIGRSVQQTSDGGYFIGGSTQSFGLGSYMYLIKTDSNGYSGCNENNPATITTNPITVVTNPATISSVGGLLISFTTQTSTGGVASSLCTTAGINENYPIDNFVNISPNPFTSQTTISFSSEQKNTIIRVINVVGEVIAQSTIKGKQYTLDMSGASKGIYFAEIIDANNNMVNKKIVVQ